MKKSKWFLPFFLIVVMVIGLMVEGTFPVLAHEQDEKAEAQILPDSENPGEQQDPSVDLPSDIDSPSEAPSYEEEGESKTDTANSSDAPVYEAEEKEGETETPGVSEAKIRKKRAASNEITVGADGDVATLEEAVNQAEEGSILILKENMEVSAPITISKNLTIRGEGKEIASKLSDSAGSMFIIESGAAVVIEQIRLFSDGSGKGRAAEVKENATLSLNSVKADGFSSSEDGGVIFCQGGTLNVEEGTFSGNASEKAGGAIFADKGADKGSAVRMVSSVFESNKAAEGGAVVLSGKNTVASVESTEFRKNVGVPKEKGGGQGGGAMQVRYSASMTANQCRFLDNVVKGGWDEPASSGGAIYFFRGKDMEIQNSSFDNNCVTEWNTDLGFNKGGLGGAIFIFRGRRILLQGNTMTGNRASGGGAICIYNSLGAVAGDEDVKSTEEYVLRDNIIRNCSAIRGGGIRIGNNENLPGEVKLESGIIENCEAEWGGGAIDYSQHEQKPLYLKNVLITGNTAQQGGGIWLCPTSETTVHSTLGGAIFGNAVERRTGFYNPWWSGDEIRYEGLNTIFGMYEKSDNTFVTVSPRAYTGAKMAWYLDRVPRYKEGDAEANPSIYTNQNKSFSLHGNLEDSQVELVNQEAKLILRNNSAEWGRGGAIASNSPIIMGEDSDVSITVEKVWEDMTPPAVSAKVSLYRVNSDGEKILLDHGVELNEANGWKTTFEKLPSKYLDKEGQEQSCTYEVKEDGTGDNGLVNIGNVWYSSRVTGNVTDGFTIINKKVPTVSFSVKKVWSDPGTLPDSIKVRLHRLNAKQEDQVFEKEVEKNKQWEAAFENLPTVYLDENQVEQEYSYSLEEEGADERGIVQIQGDSYRSEVKGNPEEGFTVTNKRIRPWEPLVPALTKVTVKKEWKGIRSDQAPEVKVALVKNGEIQNQTLVLHKENNWTAVFDALPVIDGDKRVAADPKAANTYGVKEVGEENGTLTVGDRNFTVSYSENVQGIITITNEWKKKPDSEDPKPEDPKPADSKTKNQKAQSEPKSGNVGVKGTAEKVPKTGDQSAALIYFTSMLLSLMVVAVLHKKRKILKR